MFHFADHLPDHLLLFGNVQIEQQFVVDLQDHLCSQILLLQQMLDAYHSQFDDIRGRPLDRCIDGIPFGHAPYKGVAGVDVTQITPAPHDGLGITFLPCFFNTGIHIFFYAGERVKIPVYQLFGFGAGDIQPLCQSESRDAIDDPEVGGLGMTAHLPCHLFERNIIDLCCGSGVDILAFPEGTDHILITAQMGHQTQLDLGIVGREKQMFPVSGYESFPDLPAPLFPYRDILQVGIGRAEPARHGNGLIEFRMDTSGPGIYQPRQRLHIRGQQLADGTELQHLADNGVRMLQLHQYLFTRGVLFCLGLFGFVRDLQMLEQDLSQLFRRRNIERLPGQGIDLLFQLLQLFP